MSEKKKSEGGFAKFCWNGETGELLGRTGLSWLKIFIFYVIFYMALAALFAMMLYVFYMTLPRDRPKLFLNDSLIKDNPGVGFRPQPDQDKNVDSTLIWFNTSEPLDVAFWGNQLKNFIDKTTKAAGVSCKFGDEQSKDKNTVCKVDTHNLGACGGNDFGYKTGTPCVLIKLNKIFRWEPIGMGKLPASEISKWEDKVKEKKVPQLLFDAMKREMDGQPDDVKFQIYNSVWIHCEGENPADKENMGRITYLPKRFIASYYYPFEMKKGYVSPFIMVQFNGITPGVVVNIECRAFAENIRPDRATRTGSVHFEILME